ncbi:MAG TPA: MarR family transcriptional regulator [Terriglobia bacterium]|nr:MarR family transcriptional regulator [Terriglobia bacterium]
MNNTDAVRKEFVQLWGSMGPFWGVSQSAARTFGWLLSRKDAATADELMKGLDMSRGAVSMACRELRDWGLVVLEKEAGSRQLSYRAETELERAMRNIVQARKRREWDPILERLREWIPQLEAERSAEAQIFRDRLNAIESLVSMVDSMADSFLKGGMLPSLGLKYLVASARKKSAKRSKS